MIHRNAQDDEEPNEEYLVYDEEGEPYTADPYFYETETDAADAYEPLTDDAEPDVFLDVPLLKVDEIDLDVENLRAHVSLQAEVLDLLKLNVGADVVLGRVHLGISGVEAQAQLRVRLDNVARIINRVLTTLDRNPEMLYELARGVGSAVQDVGSGARYAVGEVGRGAGTAVQDVGWGAGAIVHDVGQGAGAAVQEVGQQAGTALHDVGHGVGVMAEDVGGGVGDTVRDVSGEASRTVARTGKKVSRTAASAADKASGVAKAAKAKTSKTSKAAKGAVDPASGAARRAKPAVRSTARKTAAERQEPVAARSKSGTRARRARAEDGKLPPRPSRRTPKGRQEPP
ncbi:hypothetical protein [Streptomyces sp. NPDC090093]|uniref:hypothetical protein n=1 Tax=Streptomyces sp. NPDC090093 TaxID=3365945 RepID=UPI003801C029